MPKLNEMGPKSYETDSHVYIDTINLMHGEHL